MSTLEQSLKTLEDNLESRYQGLVLWTSFLSGGDEYHAPIVRIMTIQIPSENRKQGLGSEVMSQIISWADDHGVMLSLSPSTDFGASSVSRLTKFYRRFGFKPNKGRNKDFRTRDSMLRNPILRKKSSGKDTSYKMPRKWDKEHCESKTCDEMGFSEKASCRPYIDCYGGKTGSSSSHMNSRVASRYLRSASSKVKPMFLGSESGAMAYSFYFMRVDKDYYYHYTYRDRAEEIIEDGFLRPNFYTDQPGARGVFAISGSYGQEVTSLQVSGSRKEHMDKVVALRFKTRTEPKYGYPEEVIWDSPVKLINPEIVSVSEAISDLRKNVDLGENFKVFYDFKKAVEIKKEYSGLSRVASRYLRSAQRDDPKLKNTGHGGLSTWFAGHGGGKPDERATWGDWIAITPIKHTVEKENGESKTYEAGDIVGPCAISSEPSWRSVTDGGKNPLKCMPRDKAHDLSKEQRATLARKKRREEAKSEGQKPVLTPTFSEEGKDLIKDKSAARPIRIDKRPLRELTDQAWDEVEKRAEKATQKGATYISEASRFPHFIVGNLSVGEESVYVTAEIDRERAGSGIYYHDDHHIIIRIKDYPANLSHPLVAKYANFEASFKRDFLSILEHEVTHAYDKILYHKNMKGFRRKNKSVAEARRYVNHSSEVKAFLQQIASESEDYLRKNYGLSRESIRDHFMEALKKSKTYFEIGGALTPKSFKYIKSAVLTHLLDQVV